MRAVALVAMLALAGCTAAPAPAPSLSVATPGVATPSADTLSGTVTVFGAASLTDTFQAIAEQFTAEHPGVTVTLNFGGSSSLATQIVEGAPADVFAAASPAPMATVTGAGLGQGAPSIFATNTLEIAVPVDNPGQVTGLADFAKPELTIALCAIEVPCGAAAKKALDAAGIAPSVDTYEQDVKAVLTKVELGEVDAGIVYVTDVLAAGDRVKGIRVTGADPAKYPILALTDNPATTAFVAFVLGDVGQKILRDAGFGAP